MEPVRQRFKEWEAVKQANGCLAVRRRPAAPVSTTGTGSGWRSRVRSNTLSDKLMIQFFGPLFVRMDPGDFFKSLALGAREIGDNLAGVNAERMKCAVDKFIAR